MPETRPPRGPWSTLREIDRLSGVSPAEKYVAILLVTFVLTGRRLPGYRLMPVEFRDLIDEVRAAWLEGGVDGLERLSSRPTDAGDAAGGPIDPA